METTLPNIKVCYLVSVNRTSTQADSKEAVDLCLKVRSSHDYGKHLVGLELSGDPRAGDFSTHEQEFTRAKENGLKITLHCGETKEQMEECQRMIDFQPDRLGHCCFLTPVQIEQVSTMGIPVEICPTSNVAAVQCALVVMLKHIKLFNKHKANMIICTDDTLLFNTNISMELFEFCKAIDMLEKEDIKNLLVRNVEAIFYDDQEYKDNLKKEIMQKY